MKPTPAIMIALAILTSTATPAYARDADDVDPSPRRGANRDAGRSTDSDDKSERDDKPTKPARSARGVTIFPLAGVMSKQLRDAPDELTRVLAKSYSAEVANVPIQDAADLMECELATRGCLGAIATSVGARKIVFGRIERKSKRFQIELSVFDSSRGESKERFVLEGETTDELVASLTGKLDSEPALADVPLTGLAKRRTVEPALSTSMRESSEPHSGGITAGTWSLVIGGGVALAVGGGLYISASRLRAEAAGAPTDSRADIDRLLALEQAGKTRAQVGGALMIAGGVVTTIGVIRAVIQKSSRRERPLVDIVPEAGGASILFTKDWP